LKQFEGTGSVLHRKGHGRPSTSQEDVDRIQEGFSRSPQKSTRRISLQLGIPQKTVLTSLDELKLRLVAATATVTPQTLENTWREIEYHLDILSCDEECVC
jgi:hypothetical protein